MSKIDITTPATVLADGMLQTANPLDATLQVVTDNVGNSSKLLLSTTEVQVNSTLRINTDNAELLDIQDTAANNRFNINRSVQKINLDFASMPVDLTTVVGAIRTATDGSNLAEVMSFLENGKIGIGTTTPAAKLQVKGSGTTSATTSLLVQDSAGSSLLNVLDNGNIGIGTGNVNPISTLQVENPLNAAVQSLSSIPTAASLLLTNTGTSVVLAMAISNNNVSYLQGRQRTGTGNAFDLSLNPLGGNVGIGTSTQTAKLQIKGSGSTFATTSLLVQNSSGTQSLKVTDDGLISIFNNRLYDGINIQKSFYILGNTTVASNYESISLRVYDGIDYVSALEVVGSGSDPRVGIGTTIPNASAKLELNSTTKGFLPPRMTTVQKNAIVTPAAGLMVYDTTLNKLCVRTAAAWETITSV